MAAGHERDHPGRRGSRYGAGRHRWSERPPDAVRGGFEETGWPHLLKPFMPDDLEEAIRNSLSVPSGKKAPREEAVAGADPQIESHRSWRG